MAEPHPATDGHRQMSIARHGGTTPMLFDFEAAGRLVLSPGVSHDLHAIAASDVLLPVQRQESAA